MKDYLLLQYVMINRKIREAGIHPLVGYLLGLIVFVLGTGYIFQKTEFAKYVVVLACLSLLFKLSEKRRTDFLHITFNDKRKIRVIENLIISLPFIAVLVFKNAFIESIALLTTALIAAVFSVQTNLSLSIPTPFSKYPFEFTVGFRKTFLVFPIAYILTIIAIDVGNFNLGIFSMLLIFLTTFGYFTKPEDEYYIWIYAYTPRSFLMHKIKVATINTSLLVSPILLGLVFYYPTELNLILLFFVLGPLFLWAVILAKYSKYPAEINFPEVILICCSMYFLPMLLAILPFFYVKSINKLKPILNDKN